MWAIQNIESVFFDLMDYQYIVLICHLPVKQSPVAKAKMEKFYHFTFEIYKLY